MILSKLVLTSKSSEKHLLSRPQYRSLKILHAALEGHKQVLNPKLAHFTPIPDGKFDKRPRFNPGEEEQNTDKTFARSEGDDIELRLWSVSSKTKIGKMSLYDALLHHVRPGIALAPLGEDKYTLVDVKNTKSETATKAEKRRGAKLFFFNTTYEKAYIVVLLKRLWSFLSSGLDCEVHVKAARNSTKAKSLFDSKVRKTGIAVYKGQEVGQFDWKSAENLAKLDLQPVHMLHLRPEVIFKAMPGGTTFTVAPIANFEEYAFVLSPKDSNVNSYVKDGAGRLMELVAKNTNRLKQIATMERIEKGRENKEKGYRSWKPENVLVRGSAEVPPPDPFMEGQLQYKAPKVAREHGASPRRQQVQETLDGLQAERSWRHKY